MRTAIFLTLLLSISCVEKRSSCDNLSSGTFDLYENGVFIGKLYRKGVFQIEEYPDKNYLTTGKLQSISDCEFRLKSYSNRDALDTITWSVTYKPLTKDTFDLEVKALFIDTLDYVYQAKIVKTSTEIPVRIDNFIKKL